MNNHIQVTLKSSTIEMNLNSPEESIYLVPELEGLTTLPEIRTSSGVNAGADGGWTSAQLFDARLISMRLVIANEDIAVVESKRRLLNTLLAQGRNEELALNITTEAGNAYTVNVRVTSVSASLDRVLHKQDFLIQFRADDPLIYGSTEGGGVEAILNVQKALGGFAIPFTFPLAIGGGSDGTVVQNVGTETVYPIITLYGNLHSPTVINRTTNQQLQIIADLASDIIWGQSQTAQGEYISITNALDIPAKLASVEMLGKAEQTTYSGKNLCNFNVAQPSGVTYNSDGTITINRAGGFNINIANINIQANETYTTSYELISGTITGADHILMGLNNAGWINSQPTGYITNTFSSSATANTLYTGGNNTYNNARIRVQIEKSSVKTAYEPYVGGTSAPNPSFPMPISTVTGENVVKIEGKNLFNQGQYTGGTNYGITTTFATEQIKVTGTTDSTHYPTYIMYADGSTTQAQWWATASAIDTSRGQFTDSGTYTLSIEAEGNISGNANGFEFILGYMDGTISGNQFVDQTTKKGSFTATKPINFIAFGFRPSLTFDTTFTIQLQKGSSVSQFEPYQGQEFEINLGKNLFDKSTASEGKYINASGAIASDSTALLSDFIKITPNTDYYISGRTTWNTIALYDGSQTYLERMSFSSVNTLVRVTNTNCAYIRINASLSNLDTLQLEKGSQATSYSAYFTPIELAKIGNYQDRIYKDDGKWYIEKQVGKVVLDGTESTLYATSGTSYAWSGAGTNFVKNVDFLTNYASTTPTSGTRIKIPNNNIYFYDSGYTSLDNLKTALASTNLVVYAPLATPTTTEITNEALIAQLDALESASLYLGVNNIGTETLNAVPTLDIGYYTSYEKQTDVVVIDSQANTITLNGLDIYNLMTEGSEFIEIAPGDNIMLLTSTQTSDDGYAEVKYKQGYLSI